MSGLASELEATNQKTETRCNGIRKEVSKAMSEQRQQLVAQSEAMAKKMDGIAAKVCFLLLPSVCRLVRLATLRRPSSRISTAASLLAQKCGATALRTSSRLSSAPLLLRFIPG